MQDIGNLDKFIELNEYFQEKDEKKINENLDLLMNYAELSPIDQSSLNLDLLEEIGYYESSQKYLELLNNIRDAAARRDTDDVEKYLNKDIPRYKYLPTIHAYFSHMMKYEKPEESLFLQSIPNTKLEEYYQYMRSKKSQKSEEQIKYFGKSGKPKLFDPIRIIFGILIIITGIIILIFAIWLIGLIISIPYVLAKGKDRKYMWYSWMALLTPD